MPSYSAAIVQLRVLSYALYMPGFSDISPAYYMRPDAGTRLLYIPALNVTGDMSNALLSCNVSCWANPSNLSVQQTSNSSLSVIPIWCSSSFYWYRVTLFCSCFELSGPNLFFSGGYVL